LQIVGRVVARIDTGGSWGINYKPKPELLGALNSYEDEKGYKVFNKAIEYRGNKSHLTSPT
jgi:hypothetical protein